MKTAAEFLDWGWSHLELGAGAGTFEEPARRWYVQRYTPLAKRFEQRGGMPDRVAEQMAAKLECAGEYAWVVAESRDGVTVEQGGRIVTADDLALGFRLMMERMGATSLCGPPP